MRVQWPTLNAFTIDHKTIGLNFFEQNLKEAIFGVTNRVRNYTSNGNGAVTATATGSGSVVLVCPSRGPGLAPCLKKMGPSLWGRGEPGRGARQHQVVRPRAGGEAVSR
jgi:hypothetical protein